METSSDENRPIYSATVTTTTAAAAAAAASYSPDVTGSSADITVDLSEGCRNANADFDPWNSAFLYRDEDVMRQHSDIRAEDASKVPLVGDKEPLSSLAAEYDNGNPILLEKIKLLGENYAALRRTRGDGNCFFRGFMFSYLEHIVETQDKAEVERITASVEECKRTLKNLGYPDFTFEDFFSLFLEQLEFALEGGSSSSLEALLERSRDQSTSDCVVMFFRFVTAGEIRKREEFFEPFVMGLANSTVDQFCKTSVEPMGEESDHVHITALTDALGVQIRVMYLDRSSCESGPLNINHHDFIPSSDAPKEEGTAEAGIGSDATGPQPKPLVTLLYRPGHYDILYSK